MLPAGRTLIRRAGGLYALERALQRRGFGLVAGADEAGRGACAGPLVVAATILPEGRRGEVPQLADSKQLSPGVREQVYQEIIERAVAHAAVIVPADEVDRRGLHVSNVAGMRRALAALAVRPEYVFTDGFGVDGFGVPGLALWKGDQVAACVAAASVVAKVTRDRIMVELDQQFPEYGFAEHKGYVTPEHAAALSRHGPCMQHRFSYVNVAAVCARDNEGQPVGCADGDPVADQARGVRRAPVDAPGRSTHPRWRSTVGVAEDAGSWGPAGVGENGHVKGGTA